jgi:hypothetical protein
MPQARASAHALLRVRPPQKNSHCALICAAPLPYRHAKSLPLPRNFWH